VQAPDVWLLDEPLTALDAEASALVATLVAAHVARGGVAAYSSHQEAHIEAAVARVGSSIRLGSRKSLPVL
jgi:heme exporter protein A